MKIRIISDIYIYLILTFIISAHLVSEKYLLLLDHTPIINSYRILNFFYGTDVSMFGGYIPLDLMSTLSINVFQKILPFLILFLSGYSMYGLSDKIAQSRITRFYMGLLYTINPYTYARMIAGHWYLLFAYAILPLAIKSFLELLEKKERKSKRKSAIKFIFFISMVAFNIHMLIITLIIMSIIFIFWSLKYRDTRDIKIIPIAIIIFILLNFYWIFPLITAKNTIIDNIGDEDYKVFVLNIDNLSDLFNIASMYGFWREGYIYAKDFIPYWQLLSLFIISLAIYGFISYYKDDKIGYLVKALGVIGIIGFILAAGINGPFGDINHWLYDNTILKGFRDSHKFVAMMVLTYAILGGLGIEKLSKNVKMK